MSLEFYFLRSSEQKIVTDMLYFSQHLDESNTNVNDEEALKIYHEYYGLTPKDFGIYALKNGEITGAIWSRRLSEYHNSNGFVKNDTPVLNIAIKPAFRGQGIAKALMEQYLQEAAAMYEMITLSTPKESVSFFEKFGFEILEGSEHKSYVADKESVIMLKTLEKKEMKEHITDFSSCKWMD
jgi:ribosomal protein S18 acetylase RimI-like enzyme